MAPPPIPNKCYIQSSLWQELIPITHSWLLSIFIVIFCQQIVFADEALSSNPTDLTFFDPSSNVTYFTEPVDLDFLHSELQSDQLEKFLLKRQHFLQKFFSGLVKVNLSSALFYSKKATLYTRAKLTPTSQAELKDKRQNEFEQFRQTKDAFVYSFKKRTIAMLMQQLDAILIKNCRKFIHSNVSGVNIGIGFNGGLGIGDGKIGQFLTAFIPTEKASTKLMAFKKGFDFEVGAKFVKNKKDRLFYIEPYFDYAFRLGDITFPAHEAVISVKALYNNYTKESSYIRTEAITKSIFPIGMVINSTNRSIAKGLMPGIGMPPVVTSLATYDTEGTRLNIIRLNIPYGKISDFILKRTPAPACSLLFKVGT